MSPERGTTRIEFDQIVERAKEMTLESGEHHPMLIAIGSRDFFALGFEYMAETHDGRLHLMREVGQLVAKKGAIGRLRQVFFISEGWMSMPADGKIPERPPSQDPERKDVLIIAGLETDSQTKHLKVLEKVRDEHQRLVQLAEFEAHQRPGLQPDLPLIDAFVESYQIAYRQQGN